MRARSIAAAFSAACVIAAFSAARQIAAASATLGMLCGGRGEEDEGRKGRRRRGTARARANAIPERAPVVTMGDAERSDSDFYVRAHGSSLFFFFLFALITTSITLLLSSLAAGPLLRRAQGQVWARVPRVRVPTRRPPEILQQLQLQERHDHSQRGCAAALLQPCRRCRTRRWG